MEYVTRSCVCRGLEFAARAASAARSAGNPVRIRDVKGKKRTSTDFAFFGGEMCRVPAEGMSVPRRALPLCRALSGLRGARPPRAGNTRTRVLRAPGRQLSPRCRGGGAERDCVCVRAPRGRWDSTGGRRAGWMPSAHGRLRGYVACDIGNFADADSGTVALSRPAWPQAAPLPNVTLLWFWFLWRLLLFV